MMFGFAYANEPCKPLLRTRLNESTESLAIDLVYVLQDERYTSVSWISCIFLCFELQNVCEMK